MFDISFEAITFPNLITEFRIININIDCIIISELSNLDDNIN
jgi:hypothetical protein